MDAPQVILAQQVLDAGRAKEIAIGDEQSKWLMENGWRYSCANPGNLWLYEKALPDGRVAVVGRITALLMQAGLDRQRELQTSTAAEPQG